MDEVGAREANVEVFAEFIELIEVSAGHNEKPVFEGWLVFVA